VKWRRQYPYEDPYWDLATYNAEVHRGIVHTPEYDARMAVQQRRFNRENQPGPPEWPDPSDTET